ncbi:hypothetical protein PROFUN_07889 [Planoprotostelium fungivorum]|uniref:F-box domain-containing protein n=1 Tax=Planoprotostelium fungivorum TaxID=1890364 RepID=A0A2P6NL13_9EUKA|nr:hypothetical protein PROFUN_07889 [Planoprotostelium fungivorum]
MTSKEVAERLSCYSMDIKNLLTAFGRGHTFADFKAVWARFGFSVIHELRADSLPASDFDQLLFSTTLGYFYVNGKEEDHLTRLGCLFCLYTLHQTQPREPKTMWTELTNYILKYVLPSHNLEAYKVFNFMKDNNVFAFSALPPPHTVQLFTAKNENSLHKPDAIVDTDTVKDVVDLNQLYKVMKEYNEAKQSYHSISEGRDGMYVINDTMVDEIATKIQIHYKTTPISASHTSLGLPVAASTNQATQNSGLFSPRPAQNQAIEVEAVEEPAPLVVAVAAPVVEEDPLRFTSTDAPDLPSFLPSRVTKAPEVEAEVEKEQETVSNGKEPEEEEEEEEQIVEKKKKKTEKKSSAKPKKRQKKDTEEQQVVRLSVNLKMLTLNRRSVRRAKDSQVTTMEKSDFIAPFKNSTDHQLSHALLFAAEHEKNELDVESYSNSSCMPADPSQTSISILPAEMMHEIFSLLDGLDLARCQIVCRNWKKLGEKNSFWHRLCEINKYHIFWLRDLDLTRPMNYDWKDVYRWYHLVDSRNFVNVKESDQDKDASKEKIDKNGYGTDQTDAGTYRGEWKDNKKEGKGIHVWPDQSRYEGEWKTDKRNGFGVYYWADGRRFAGDHRNDKRSRGIFYWPEGSIYDGEYLDSHRHGRGKFTWPDGDSYEGGWMKGGRFGKGTLTCVQKGEEGVYIQDNWAEENFEFFTKGDKTVREEEEPSPPSRERNGEPPLKRLELYKLWMKTCAHVNFSSSSIDR